MRSQSIRLVCLRADVCLRPILLPQRISGINGKLHVTKTTSKIIRAGNTAVFVASDKASAITGTTINITCGSVVD